MHSIFGEREQPNEWHEDWRELVARQLEEVRTEDCMAWSIRSYECVSRHGHSMQGSSMHVVGVLRNVTHFFILSYVEYYGMATMPGKNIYLYRNIAPVVRLGWLANKQILGRELVLKSRHTDTHCMHMFITD